MGERLSVIVTDLLIWLKSWMAVGWREGQVPLWTKRGAKRYKILRLSVLSQSGSPQLSRVCVSFLKAHAV